jgi:hypothetical protein
MLLRSALRGVISSREAHETRRKSCGEKSRESFE